MLGASCEQICSSLSHFLHIESPAHLLLPEPRVSLSIAVLRTGVGKRQRSGRHGASRQEGAQQTGQPLGSRPSRSAPNERRAGRAYFSFERGADINEQLINILECDGSCVSVPN